ncbi:uncharacterized protein BXZ73DRAFT_42927 [Epithele typhae]|uniref:uncharacterized protein n=1 Tax=Epithele typhae TaxID=378194 RepID=UPI002007A64E|nr:uncharacterized protein BXZ73DRAFT_42927 [Epithele typhae]KAH9940407.1 hypothetical protein BXZ73DRAFT_42927 [Epithele typhae]
MDDIDIDDFTVDNILDPLMSFLSSVLPPAAMYFIRPLITYSLALLSALVRFGLTAAHSENWDTQKILPPLITVLMAYLALVSFYRTTGWMLRTVFWCFKWGGIIASLAGLAGYLLATQGNADAVGGIGGGGAIPMIMSALLGMFSEDAQRGRAGGGKSKSNPGLAAKPRRRRDKAQEREQPKAWESWDKHREHKDWQHGAEAEYRDEAARMNEGVQEAVMKVAEVVQGALKESWWGTIKNAVEGSGLVGSAGMRDEEAGSDQRAKRKKEGRAGSR